MRSATVQRRLGLVGSDAQFIAQLAPTHGSSPGWLPGVVTIAFRASDAFVLIAAALLVSVIYLPSVYDQAGGMTVELRLYYYLLVFSALIVQVNVFHFAGIYRFETLSNLSFQIGRCWMAVAILFLVILALLYLTRLSEIYSRGWMLLWFRDSARRCNCRSSNRLPGAEEVYRQRSSCAPSRPSLATGSRRSDCRVTFRTSKAIRSRSSDCLMIAPCRGTIRVRGSPMAQ